MDEIDEIELYDEPIEIKPIPKKKAIKKPVYKKKADYDDKIIEELDNHIESNQYDYQQHIRKDRGLKQKLFLIETKNDYEYLIMGLTGNVYTVSVTNKPTCTCPDHTTRNNRCKHIYFVFQRVLRTENCDKEVYTNDELVDFIKNKNNIDKNVCVSENIKSKYHKLAQKKSNKTSVIDVNLDDLCPLCLDELDNGEEVDWCKADCGKAVHKLCFKVCSPKYGAKCPYCNKAWNPPENESTYINLLS